jgi:hypothetical protein
MADKQRLLIEKYSGLRAKGTTSKRIASTAPFGYSLHRAVKNMHTRDSSQKALQRPAI